MLFLYLRTYVIAMHVHARCLVPVHSGEDVAVGLELVLLFVFMTLSFVDSMSTRPFGLLTLERVLICE